MRCLTVESGNLSIVNNNFKDEHSSKYWENMGKRWAGLDLWCTLGNGPEIGKTNFVLGVGAGNGETSTGQALLGCHKLNLCRDVNLVTLHILCKFAHLV